MPRPEVTFLERSWDALLPQFSRDEQTAGRTLLRELARGGPVSSARLAAALRTPVGEAEALLRSSALSPFVYRDADGQVVGFWGLSTVAMHHRFMVGDRALWTWCAEDSLFLPELIDTPADVESRDPESGISVRLSTPHHKYNDVSEAASPALSWYPPRCRDEESDAENEPIQDPPIQGGDDRAVAESQQIYVAVLSGPAREDDPLGSQGSLQ